MAVVAHWKLNDNAASATVLDATGVHNGTYKDGGGNINTSTGSTANSRGVGTCLDFDGGDEYVEIADHADFTPALTPFSISVWLYMHDASDFQIASKGVFNTDGEWYFNTETGDRVRLLLFDESEDDCYIGRRYTTALSQNIWLYIIATYNGGTTSASIKLYLNGAKVDNANDQNNQGNFVAISAEGHAVWIGRVNVSYGNGLIDNVIFFNHELNIDEVKALYNGGHGTEIVGVIDDSRRIPRR